MEQTFTNFISCIRAFALSAFCFLPFFAFAQFGGGSGTETDPYKIATGEQLAQLATFVNGADVSYSDKCYILTADIELCAYNAANTAFNGGKGWIPIGNSSINVFKGVFDGNNKTITGLYINDDVIKYAGLFGYISGGTIKNTGVKNISVSGMSYLGGVVGYAYESSISNCYTTGTVSGKDDVGGIGGYVKQNCDVTNCYSTVNVSGHTEAGGIVGFVYEGSISNCYSTGDVSGTGNDIGGIVGFLRNGSISNCAALNPSVKGLNLPSFGRVVGRTASSTLTNNIAFDGILNKDGNTTWSNTGLTNKDGENITKQTINSDGSLGNRFVATNGWKIENGKLPGLFNNTVELPLHLMTYAGTPTDPYIITTADQLAQLTTLVNIDHPLYDKNYKLANDIDLSNYGACFNGGKGWIPIGRADIYHPFKGTFDGNNKKITGLYIDDDYLGCVGLFGDVADGTIKNVGVENVNINGGGWVGGVVGSAQESSNITNCYSTGNVNAAGMWWCVGGVIGYVGGNCNVTNCYSTGAVSGNCNYVGGVVGAAEDYCTVTNCYSTGAVSGSVAVGGVVGVAGNSCNVTNCYSTGAVSGNEDVGGVTGGVWDGSISNCAALNPSVKGNSNVGRVVGNLGGAVNTLTNNIAFDGILNKAGNTTWSNTGLTNKDGEDMSKQTINNDGTLGGRFNAPVWTTQKGSLPGLFGNTVVMLLHLRIPGMVYITTDNLPDGKVGVSYSETLTADGYTPITWSVIANALPLGLTLDPTTGEISGTPTTKGPFTFTVKAVNSVGDDTKTLTITIGDGVGIETITNDELRITVYPNPTTGVLNLIQDHVTSDALHVTNGTLSEVEVFDIYGKRHVSRVTRNEGEFVLDISHFPAGIYFLRIDGETVKVVKN